MRRRIVVTVCPREAGTVALPLERGGRARRMNAAAVLRHLAALAERRGLGDRVRVREGCVGGCARRGPNVGVASYPPRRPGARPDQVAIGWRTYVHALAALECLARVIDDNLGDMRDSGRVAAPLDRVTRSRALSRRAGAARDRPGDR